MKSGHLPVLVGLSLTLSACGENIVGALPPGVERPEPEPLPVDPGDGMGELVYPAGPYGGEEGEVVPNMRFAGYFTPEPNGLVMDAGFREDITLQEIRELGHDYLLLNLSAEWCLSCRAEAEVMNEHFGEWIAEGGFVLGITTQDARYRPASRETLDSWASAFNVSYSMVHDPNAYVANTFAPTTMPVNAIIKLEDMTVVRVRVGDAPEIFRQFDNLLQE